MGAGSYNPASSPRLAPRRAASSCLLALALCAVPGSVAAAPEGESDRELADWKSLSARLLSIHERDPQDAFCREAFRIWDHACALVHGGGVAASDAEKEPPPVSGGLRTHRLDLGELLAALECERAILVGFSLGPDQGWAMMAGGGGLRPVRIPDWEQVGELSAVLREALATRGDQRDRPAANRLSALLVDPWIHLVPHGTRRLIIMPDPAMVGLPFEVLTLPERNGARRRMILDMYETAYTPSASCWLALKRRPRPPDPRTALIAGVGAGAGVRAFDGEPAEDTAETDALTGAARLPVGPGGGPELLILGAWPEEDTPSGLPTAALRGGARAVVAPVWLSGDRAGSAFLRELHRNLSRGHPAMDAVRAAKRTLAHSDDPVLADPASWAPYLFLGDTASRPEVGSRWPVRTAVIGLLGLAVVTFGLRLARFRITGIMSDLPGE